jgi:hypothetical protein
LLIHLGHFIKQYKHDRPYPYQSEKKAKSENKSKFAGEGGRKIVVHNKQ